MASPVHQRSASAIAFTRDEYIQAK